MFMSNKCHYPIIDRTRLRAPLRLEGLHVLLYICAPIGSILVMPCTSSNLLVKGFCVLHTPRLSRCLNCSPPHSFLACSETRIFPCHPPTSETFTVIVPTVPGAYTFERGGIGPSAFWVRIELFDLYGSTLYCLGACPSLIQVPSFYESVDLFPCILLIELLLAFIERNHLLDGINHSFDIHCTFRKPD